MSYSNPGKVDVERAAESIVNSGGGITSRWQGDHTHHSAYSKSMNWHLSWDEYPDGTIKNVHSDKDGHAYMFYGN